MSVLKRLREAVTLHDIARLLGYKPSALSYLLYKMPAAEKYVEFQIPKKSGGVRIICAPVEPLKALQRRLANVLYACFDEIEQNEPWRKGISHGFRKNFSIITNARKHRARRYVLNVDIQDFFPSFNFGRVRGFFIKSKEFSLNDKVATIIAQVACHGNGLPQGSPCSPIIADMIAHVLDVSLARLAKKNGVTYSRYANDLTFSTNKKEFPPALASRAGEAGSEWILGQSLVRAIERTGFLVNDSKTRMQCKANRQIVTGLTVNKKVNIRSEYYRSARAMCHSLFSSGTYYRAKPIEVEGGGLEYALIDEVSQIHGIVSHIYYVKNQESHRNGEEERAAKEKFTPNLSARRLYERLLFYKYFVALKKPLILCEGKTDNIYLRAAFRQLSEKYTDLGFYHNGKFIGNVSFFGHDSAARHASCRVQSILKLGGGTGGICKLIERYNKEMAGYNYKPLEFPVVIVIDNDDGAGKVFSASGQSCKVKIDHKSSKEFYHLCHNLYLVKTPEANGNGFSCMEDLFEQEVRDEKLNGKIFKCSNDKVSENEYGKNAFAEKVIRPNAERINFEGFVPLIERIVGAINDYRESQGAHSIGELAEA